MDTNPTSDPSITENVSENRINQRMDGASRRAALLNAAAKVSRTITSILDPEELLARTVDIICDEYGFYYSGIFLVERLEDGKDWAVLKAGRGKAGRIMMENNHKLEVGGRSMIGACTARNEARISLDVESGSHSAGCRERSGLV